MPDVHVNLRSRLAGLGVNDLDVEEERNTLLVLHNVRTDHFTSDICIGQLCKSFAGIGINTVRTLGHIRTKNTSRVVGKELLRVDVGGHTLQGRVVGGVQSRIEITSFEERSIYSEIVSTSVNRSCFCGAGDGESCHIREPRPRLRRRLSTAFWRRATLVFS